MKPTTRELQILLAVAKAEPVAEIARRLGVSIAAVKENLLRARERYGAPNNEAAIATALDRGDIGPATPVKSNVALTAFELALLERIAMGQENKTLSAELSVSERTVNRCTASLLRKLGAANRCQAVFLGGRYGLLVGYRERQTRQARYSEIQALTAIAHSRNVDEAAAMLGLKSTTVSGLVRRSQRRLDARTSAQAVAKAIRQGEVPCPRTNHAAAKSLTLWEQKVVAFIVAGLTNVEIAWQLNVKFTEFEKDLGKMHLRLGAKSNAHAVYLLFQQGILG